MEELDTTGPVKSRVLLNSSARESHCFQAEELQRYITYDLQMLAALRGFFIYEVHLEHCVSETLMEEVSVFEEHSTNVKIIHQNMYELLLHKSKNLS